MKSRLEQKYSFSRQLFNSVRLRSLNGYLFSIAAILPVLIVGLLTREFLEPTTLILIFLLPAVMSATLWGIGPSIFSSFLTTIIFDALFDPPYGLFSPKDYEDLLRLGVFLIIPILIAKLGSQVLEQEQAARHREKQTTALFTLTRNMALANDRSELLDVAIEQISQVCGVDATVLLLGEEGALQPYRESKLDGMDLLAAQKALENNQLSEFAVPGLAQAGWFYMPLKTAQGTFGVLCLRRRAVSPSPTQDQSQLLMTFAAQIAVALEHAKLSEQAEQGRILESSERFRNALLSSLSHDLLSPITSIMGSVTTLLDKEAQLDTPTGRELLDNTKEDATHLRSLVLHMLDMTRVESGTLAPQRDWHSVEEVVGAALAHGDTDGREVRLSIEPHLPLIPFDFVLIEQVLLNLLDNAHKYSPPNSPVELSAQLDRDYLRVIVSDRGIGVPPDDLARIFEKFYRLPQSSRVFGTGLGLAICKGIVEAHGGTIWAECREGGGTRVIFMLPARTSEAVR